MKVYLCYGWLFGDWVLEKVVSDFEQAVSWVSQNTDSRNIYLKYEEWEVE
jgi:hypothetical protein